MNIENLLDKAIKLEELTIDEGLFLYENAPFVNLCSTANKIRQKIHSNNIVTWQIDRNVNITNVCIGSCKFCNFHCRIIEKEKAYLTSIEEYRTKIEELIAQNGDQLLLQGGMHPKLDIVYYENLFRTLKSEFPQIKLHALGAPEVYHIAKISSLDTKTTLQRLMDAGLDSLPGAGAEILDTVIRKELSPMKCSAEDWLRIMKEAWELGLTTSATMVYGHIESPRHRIEHLVKIRELQSHKKEDQNGFLAFIPWPMCINGTKLENHPKLGQQMNANDHLRITAISRIMLTNVKNVQASYLTLGVDIAKQALNCGANDLGSIMIEENVVSSTGVRNIVDAERMQQIITEAGYIPQLRNQLYQKREIKNGK
ncbi:MAG: CofH family radical SAM protein [Rikenellaceae bacterium]